ncbi:MAG TPA: lipopolysaccharide biosynthesis protein [Gemmatimonadales bacterium]|nr:lipopolysaccharide biosynthesis protein [Gemmatimonadales bacterium]
MTVDRNDGPKPAATDPVGPGDAAPAAVPPGLTKRALGGMAWTFSGQGIQGVVQLLVIMALGRLLSPSDFGLFGAAAVVVALSQIVSQIGVGPAIVQRKELDDEHVRVAFTISGVLGVVLGVVVWAAAPALAAFYRIPSVEPVLRGVAFLFPIDGLNTVGESLLTRQLRFRLFVAMDVASYVLGYACVGVLLAWQGYGVWALVGANLSQVTVRTIGMYLATMHPVRPSLNVRAGRDLLRFGFGHSLAQLGTVLSQQGDNMVVGRWLGPVALGVYGRAYSLMVLPATVFGKTVNRVLFPVMSQVQDERSRLAGAYERSLAVVALVALPISAFLWVVAPEFIPLLLGPKWMAVVLPFRMFSISLLFRMSSKISDASTKAAGAVYSRALLQGVFAVMVVGGSLIGQRWGIGGVAVAVSVAMGVNWIMMAALSRSVTGLSWPRFIQAHVPGALLAVLLGLVVAGVAGAVRTAHLGGLPVLAVSALAAVAVVAAVSHYRLALFLGPHGMWASAVAGEFVGKVKRKLRGFMGGRADRLANASSE